MPLNGKSYEDDLKAALLMYENRQRVMDRTLQELYSEIEAELKGPSHTQTKRQQKFIGSLLAILKRHTDSISKY